MTPTNTPDPAASAGSTSDTGAPAPKSLKAALAAAEAPAAPVDPLADPPTIEGVPLTSYRLPDWFIWAALGAAFVVVGGIGVLVRRRRGRRTTGPAVVSVKTVVDVFLEVECG